MPPIQDEHGRDPENVRILNAAGNGYIDFADVSLTQAEAQAAFSAAITASMQAVVQAALNAATLAAARWTAREDDAAVAAAYGIPLLGVRHDTLTVLESADGDESRIVVDKYGRIRIAPAFLQLTASIPNAQALTPEIDTTGRSLAGIVIPSAGWTAAVITFQVSNVTGGTYVDLYDDNGNEVTVQAAAGRAIGIDAAALGLAPYQFVKIRSGTTATPVNQGAQRDLIAIMKGY